MALRSLVGKLRGPPAAVAASRAFSQTCEHCGKRSSRIAGQKNGPIKDDLSELDSSAWKHYMIRGFALFTHGCASWFAFSYGVAYLENGENFRRKK